MPQQQIDITNLPAAEDERFEYKSSITPINTLKDKLVRAASGFWNSGGGVFIVGVDDSGKPDGGFAMTVGKTAIRDWIDQVLKEVSPAGTYSVQLFPHDPAAGLNIAASQCVIAVDFEESARPPHMAPDHKYYIRAGAHTVPATHYIVEALWARRRAQRPQLAHTMQPKPDTSDTIQLVILSLTEEPATNVTIILDPLPEMWRNSNTSFPLTLPVIDRTTPFYLDITTFHAAEERLGQDVELQVAYEDFAKNRYNYSEKLDIKSISPWRIGSPANESMAKSLDSIDKTLKSVPVEIKNLHEETSQIRGRIEIIQKIAFSKSTTKATKLAKRLSSDARALIKAASNGGTITYSPYIGGLSIFAGNSNFISNPSDKHEAARWKSAITELRDLELIEGIFVRSASSLFQVTKLGYDIADALTPAKQ